MNEDQLRELFREMRNEPVPADSLARVRAGVDLKIQKRTWLIGWKPAAALVMLACIVAGFFLLRPGKAVPPREAIVRPVAPEARVLPAAEIPVAPERPAVRVVRPRRAQPRPVEAVPVLIRIETPDPDVVILLVN